MASWEELAAESQRLAGELLTAHDDRAALDALLAELNPPGALEALLAEPNPPGALEKMLATLAGIEQEQGQTPDTSGARAKV
jgi:hypothetical protein